MSRSCRIDRKVTILLHLRTRSPSNFSLHMILIALHHSDLATPALLRLSHTKSSASTGDSNIYKHKYRGLYYFPDIPYTYSTNTTSPIQLSFPPADTRVYSRSYAIVIFFLKIFNTLVLYEHSTPSCSDTTPTTTIGGLPTTPLPVSNSG